MMSTAFVLATALLLGSPKVEINVNTEEGQSLSGVHVFRLTVTSDHPVSQVEFYVGSDLRETDTSTPYEFMLDTLTEKDGALQVSFAAYTTEGESAKKALNVRIDTQLSKGADFNVNRGNELLAVSKWDEAIQAGRTALLIDSNSNPARLVMARAYLGKGVLDQAQRYAEDAIASNANFREAKELLAAINLRRAFVTFNRGENRQETLVAIQTAMKDAIEVRKQVLDEVVDSMGTPNDSNRMAYADAAIRAGRYSAAILALTPAFRSTPEDSAIANRLAYAQLRAMRLSDAAATLREHRRRTVPDAFGWMLVAILEAHQGNNNASDEAVREAVLSDAEDLGVQTGQAYLALKRRQFGVLRQLIASLARDESQRTEVQYYISIASYALTEFEPSRQAFEAAVLSEPANSDMYVQRGNEALALVAAGRLDAGENEFQVKVAKAFYEAALTARPNAPDALTALAIVNVYDKKTAEGYRFAKAAVAASPGYPAGHYVLAMVASIRESELRAAAEAIRTGATGGVLTSSQRQEMDGYLQTASAIGKEAADANRTAGELDKTYLAGRVIPTKQDANQYFLYHGRVPLLVPPK